MGSTFLPLAYKHTAVIRDIKSNSNIQTIGSWKLHRPLRMTKAHTNARYRLIRRESFRRIYSLSVSQHIVVHTHCQWLSTYVIKNHHIMENHIVYFMCVFCLCIEHFVPISHHTFIPRASPKKYTHITHPDVPKNDESARKNKIKK